MSSEAPTPSDAPFRAILEGVQDALLHQPASLVSFLSTFYADKLPQQPPGSPPADAPPERTASDPAISTLFSFFRDQFPQPVVSSLDAWPETLRTERDPAQLSLHGRITAALMLPQSEDNLRLLRFIVVIIILHELGHVVVVHFHTPTLTGPHKTFPYHISGRAFPVVWYPEEGFSVEETLFGGIIGAVFEDEDDGIPPKFFLTDFTRISYLFLHCRNGNTYRLNPADVAQNIDSAGSLEPFDVEKLEVIPTPRDLRDRTCAMLNGNHLCIKNRCRLGKTFPAERPPFPPDFATAFASKCAIRRFDSHN